MANMNNISLSYVVMILLINEHNYSIHGLEKPVNAYAASERL